MSERGPLREWLADDLLEALGLDGAPSGAALAGAIDRIAAHELWNLRARARERMIERLDAADSDALWIGWAGPMTAASRPGLLFADLARLDRLLDDPVNAVRVVIAGSPVGELATRIAELVDEPRFAGRVLHLPGWPNTHIHTLIEGVDLWLGTAAPETGVDPTHALAAAANGAINISTRVDWWIDVESDDKGWSFGGFEAQDPDDARGLYELLERTVVPLFYAWDREAISQRWIDRVRASVRTLAPRW